MSSYHRPTTLDDGLALLSGHPVIVAGATDLYPARTQQHAWGQSVTEQWLDISNIQELHGIEELDDHWRIGSMVTWSELIREALPSYFDGLRSAAREVGGKQIQNRATLAGNLCNASPAADGVPPLLCLDARVELTSLEHRRVIALSDFLRGNRETALASNELLTAIIIPHLTNATSSYFFKLGARKYLVISIVMASMVIAIDSNSTILDVRIAVGSCSVVAQRMTSLEADLIGKSTADDLGSVVKPYHLKTLNPIDDIRADADYRRHAALETLRRMIGSASSTARHTA